ncbi:hypothetical protein GCM10027404_24030 [Arthrobacter tumbae]|uniref:DUF4262 domain-containing protein n=1 Tax=Arthrobacter tumbae TaxID=163874 RepID=UPI00195964D9|nr:DUF4262 domain-containing protein [Arthrobacter tumbae]MBM7781428.1 hypothetical protein [Arthrobacter tumbae]
MTDLIFHPHCSSLEFTNLRRNDFNRERIEAQLAREDVLVRFSQAHGEVPCAYTVGLTGQGLPELILYGQSPGHVHHAWSLIEPALHLLTQTGVRVFHGQFDGQTVEVRQASLRRLRDAFQLYGQEGFSALQVYWTVGSDNHLPQQWEIRFLAAQPFLGGGSLGDLLGGKGST